MLVHATLCGPHQRAATNRSGPCGNRNVTSRAAPPRFTVDLDPESRIANRDWNPDVWNEDRSSPDGHARWKEFIGIRRPVTFMVTDSSQVHTNQVFTPKEGAVLWVTREWHETIEKGNPSDRWDRGTITRHYKPPVFTVNHHPGDEPLIVDSPGPLTDNDDIWVMTAWYSTGDTFGRTVNMSSVVYATATRERMQQFEEMFDPGNEPKSEKWMRVGGREVRGSYFPWMGYFDRLTRVEVDVFTVRPD